MSIRGEYMLKELKCQAIITSVLYIVLGIVLIVYPDVSLSVLTTVLGIALIVSGVIDMVSYFLMDVKGLLASNSFVRGTMLFVLGLVVMFQTQTILGIIPILLGFVIVISGINKLQQAITAKRVGYQRASTYIVLAIISIVLGLAIMFFLNGQNIGDALFICIGVGLVYSGLSDLYATLFVTKKFHDFVSNLEKAKEDHIIDVEVQESESEE